MTLNSHFLLEVGFPIVLNVDPGEGEGEEEEGEEEEEEEEGGGGR